MHGHSRVFTFSIQTCHRLSLLERQTDIRLQEVLKRFGVSLWKRMGPRNVFVKEGAHLTNLKVEIHGPGTSSVC